MSPFFIRFCAAPLLALFLLSGASTRTAKADYITYTVGTGLNKTDYSASISIPIFPTSLGTLQDVVITVTNSANFSGSLTNMASDPQSFNVSEVINLSLKIGSTNQTDSLTANQSFANVGSGQSVTFGPTSPTNTQPPITLTSGALFDSLNGNGPVDFMFSTNTITAITGGGGNIKNKVITEAGTSILIRYDYLPTPEPASMALIGFGGAIVVAGHVARRNRGARAS